MKVGILYGGKSVEHEISIRSARNVVANMDDKYELTLIGISKSGKWYLQSDVSDSIKTDNPVKMDLGSKIATVLDKNDTSFELDLVFPILHGTDGEDGSIQGLFQCLNIPVVGTSVLGSAISMDKIVSKKLLAQAGIPVAPYMSFRSEQSEGISFDLVKERLGVPFMIKAGNLGSSIGISKVTTPSQFDHALKESLRYSGEVLIESFVNARELECGVIGNEVIQSTVPGEIILKGDYDFYTYDAKYTDEKAIEIKVPADVSEEVSQKIRRLCEAAYLTLKCEDFARVDLFLTEDDEVLINEINSIPGFTSVSMFPMLWANMGIGYTDLLNKLIDMAIRRWEKQKQLERDYTTS